MKSIEDKNLKHCFKPGKFLPGFLLWKVNILWQREMTHHLEKIDLTPVQFYLLSGLEKLGQIHGAVTQVELARFIDMNIMMTSNVLRTLEKKGLLKRVEHPSDTRANCLEITERGRELRGKAIAISQEINEKFFDMNSDETKTFVEYLMKLMEQHHHEQE